MSLLLSIIRLAVVMLEIAIRIAIVVLTLAARLCGFLFRTVIAPGMAAAADWVIAKAGTLASDADRHHLDWTSTDDLRLEQWTGRRK